MKTKQAKKNHYQDLFKKNKQTNLGSSVVNVERESKSAPCSLKQNGALLFNPVRIAETFNFFFPNIGRDTTKRIPKGKIITDDISKK